MNSGRLVVILILFMLGPKATLVAQKCPICDSALGAQQDRVRKTEPRLRQPAATVVNVWSVAQAPAPVPDTLTLLGLSGSGANCRVLINDRSFQRNESGKVRYANTNAWVRCIEIRDNSVVIQVEGTAERQELFLKAK